jgi:hypothetical protein
MEIVCRNQEIIHN